MAIDLVFTLGQNLPKMVSVVAAHIDKIEFEIKMQRFGAALV